MGTIFLQLFLMFDVFLIGALSAIAYQHARAHFKPNPQDEKPVPPVAPVHLPRDVKERLLQDSQANFKSVLDASALELQRDLISTAGQLNNLLKKIGGEIVGNEMERYRVDLVEIRKHAEASIESAQAALEQHQAELKSTLAQEVAAEKQHLLQQIDTKLADAVGSFLLETLQHNVDLGAQNPYLLALLEEHKADFTKEVADEAPAAK